MNHPSLPITRPLRIADNLAADEIIDVDFSLFDLFTAEARKGHALVAGKRIVGCRIQGPAVMLASIGVTFDEVNFGDNGGDIRNLILKGEGTRAIGAIPFRECAFLRCEFYGVGFTGPEEFLAQMRALRNDRVDN